MSIATIIFEDIDQDNGRFACNVNVEDTQTADGLASAAHVTAMFIASVVNTAEFAEGTVAYAQAKGWSLRMSEPQRLVLTLKDVDLQTGSFDLTVEENENALFEGSATAAYMAGSFVKDAMGSAEFRMACTEYAYGLTENRDDATVNEPTIQPAANTNLKTEAA